MSRAPLHLAVEPIVLEGKRLRLRTLSIEDYDDWAALRSENRDFLQPWEPRWIEDELSYDTFRKNLFLCTQMQKMKLSYCFSMISVETDKLIGGAYIRDIKRGVNQSCFIGSWLGEPYARKGYSRDGLQLFIDFIFQRLNLNRIEAACCINNLASKRLLETSGFVLEGRGQAYMKINGQWRDHWLFAKVKETSSFPEDKGQD